MNGVDQYLRQVLWEWVEHRNGHKNTDVAGFSALSSRDVFNLILDAMRDKRWKEFYRKRRVR